MLNDYRNREPPARRSRWKDWLMAAEFTLFAVATIVGIWQGVGRLF
jgi:cytochrome oxidase assembly protein ShyY1